MFLVFLKRIFLVGVVFAIPITAMAVTCQCKDDTGQNVITLQSTNNESCSSLIEKNHAKQVVKFAPITINTQNYSATLSKIRVVSCSPLSQPESDNNFNCKCQDKKGKNYVYFNAKSEEDCEHYAVGNKNASAGYSLTPSITIMKKNDCVLHGAHFQCQTLVQKIHPAICTWLKRYRGSDIGDR